MNANVKPLDGAKAFKHPAPNCAAGALKRDFLFGHLICCKAMPDRHF